MRKQHLRLRRWELAALALAALCLLALALGAHDQRALADRVVRLHVQANSDSEADQALKLAVRDAVLSEAEKQAEHMRDEYAGRGVHPRRGGGGTGRRR